MVNSIRTRTLTYTALYVALGVLLPIAFHAVGLGKVFLPMHIPVFLAGILSGPVSGLITGILAPLLSSLLTGMPPMMPPTAQAMVFELGVYGLLSGLLAHRLRLHPVVALVGGMAAGRIVYGFLAAFILPLFGFKPVPLMYPLTVSVVSSLPGLALQLVVVPVVVSILRKAGRAQETIER